MRAYRGSIALLAAVLVGLGLALLVEGIVTRRVGGLVLGVLFVAAGGGRLYLLRRR